MNGDIFILAANSGSSLSSHFTLLDWLVVLGYFVLTTAIGSLMAGKQATIRDFFLGGRKLPWYAVCGSNIATEISAVTFVSVPAVVFAPAGNFTYLQIGIIGSLFARLIVAWFFVPAYYKREIYSPYDYMANELGSSARTVTTCLFILGGSLAQGARVYLTALILDLIIGEQIFGSLANATHTQTMTWSIYTIGAISILWTYMGGITTVIWTDVILFLVFLIGALVSLGAVVHGLPGGWSELFAAGWNVREAGQGAYMINWGKFTCLDFNPSPAQTYTIWTAAIASTWGGLGAYGTDQMMAQRIFCCKSQRQAQIAVVTSYAAQIITLTMLMVGLGLYVFYQHYPLQGESAKLVDEDRERVFPVFIIEQLRPGVTGLVIAGIFAAAVSTLVSVISAFSQTTLSAFYLPWRMRVWAKQGKTASLDDAMKDPKLVTLSRVLVVVWGVILCLMAQVAGMARTQYPAILDLALAMAGFTGGAILAGFMLAFLKLNVDARGFIWSAPLSVFTVFAFVWHDSWSHPICWGGAAIMLITWLVSISRDARSPTVARWLKTMLLLAGSAGMLWINYHGYLDTKLNASTGKISYTIVAWPWYTPIGSLVALLFGYALGRPKPPNVAPAPAH